MNILKAVDLQKIYGQGETEVKALDGVNLEVEKGEFVAIVGTSGSGKSTMLHIIGGLDNPTSGQVIVDGQNLSHMTDEELTIFRRRNIGFVFQQYNLVPMLNVWENIVLPVKLDGKNPVKYFCGYLRFLFTRKECIERFRTCRDHGVTVRINWNCGRRLE